MRHSPAFELNPNPSTGRKHLATAIEEADTTASVETLMSVTPLFRLGEQDSVGVLREVLVATSRWREVPAKRHLPKVEIEQVAPAFEHAETERLGPSPMPRPESAGA